MCKPGKEMLHYSTVFLQQTRRQAIPEDKYKSYMYIECCFEAGAVLVQEIGRNRVLSKAFTVSSPDAIRSIQSTRT